MVSGIKASSTTTISWWSETPHLFSATLATRQGRRYLVVERLPEGGWDWVTWYHGRQIHTLHGKAITAELAMTAAARAAQVESFGAVHFLPPSCSTGLHI